MAIIFQGICENITGLLCLEVYWEMLQRYQNKYQEPIGKWLNYTNVQIIGKKFAKLKKNSLSFH